MELLFRDADRDPDLVDKFFFFNSKSMSICVEEGKEERLFPPLKLLVCIYTTSFFHQSCIHLSLIIPICQLVNHYHQSSIIIRSSCLLLSLLLMGHRCPSIFFSQVIVPAARRHCTFSICNPLDYDKTLTTFICTIYSGFSPLFILFYSVSPFVH